MYECGRRVACEVLGLVGLQRQAKCYLAAINCLRLVDSKYAWIVQPAENVISVSSIPSIMNRASYLVLIGIFLEFVKQY